jgi:Putative Ig domain
MKTTRVLLNGLISLALFSLIACGGGGSSSSTKTQPVVAPLVISTQGLSSGTVNQPYSGQLAATGGVAPYHWTLGTPLAGLALNATTGALTGTPTAAFNGAVSVTVADSASPAHSASATPSLHIAALLEVGTSSLPSVVSNSNVDMELATRGGTQSFTWSLISGTLPTGLTLSSVGTITGTVTGGSSTFTVGVSDQSIPTPLTATRTLTLNVIAAAGRNDTIATATPLSNGAYFATISPISDPPGLPAKPDVDVYSITADPGAVVHLETIANRLPSNSPLDSVIELTDASGIRLQTCSTSATGPFTTPCMNDDIIAGISTDSLLFFQVPSTATGPVTVFLKVLDFRGDARPDMVYALQIDGAK